MEKDERPTIPPWPDAALLVGCGKSKIYELIAAGEVEAIRIGRYIRVLEGGRAFANSALPTRERSNTWGIETLDDRRAGRISPAQLEQRRTTRPCAGNQHSNLTGPTPRPARF